MLFGLESLGESYSTGVPVPLRMIFRRGLDLDHFFYMIEQIPI